MEQNFKEVFRYVRAAYRYRIVAVVLALLVMTVVGIYSFTLPKIYQASSTVFIEKSVIDNLVRGIAVTPSVDDKIRVLRYALLSRDLIVKTLEDIESDVFVKSRAEQQNFIAGLQERIRINVRGQDLFIVTLMGQNPAFITNFVNSLVRIYVQESLTSKRDEAYGANRFLEEQIETFKQKLEEADDAIIAFRREQGIYFTLDERATIEEIRRHMEQIEALDLKIASLEANQKQLQDQLATLSPTIESVFQADSGGAPGQGIDSHPQLVAMQQRLSDLRLRYTDSYPEIVRLQFEISALRERLQSEAQTSAAPVRRAGQSSMTSLNPLYLDVQQRMLQVQSEMSEARTQKMNVTRLLNQREKELHEVPEAKKQLNVMVQERDSYQKIYQDLLARMSQSEVSKQMEISDRTTTFRIVDPAIYPESPVSPNMMKMLLLAIAAGGGVAVGVVFLLENFDSRIRNPGIIESSGVEILAVIPNISTSQQQRRQRLANICLVLGAGIYFVGFLGVFAYQFLYA